MNFGNALNMRYEQRKKYLNDSNFECLSNILPIRDDRIGKRDNFLFIYLLCGGENEKTIHFRNPNQDDVEKVFLENYKRPGINWRGIYDYYQARRQSIRDHNWYEPHDYDVYAIINILKKYEDKIIKSYVTF